MRGIAVSRIPRKQIKIKYATKIVLVPSFLQRNKGRQIIIKLEIDMQFPSGFEAAEKRN